MIVVTHSPKTIEQINFSNQQLLSVEKNENGIPKIIHRTFKTRDLNGIMYQKCHQKWIDLNPGYVMIWQNDEEADEFMHFYNDNFDNRVWEVYDKLNPGAYKADLWRLCRLEYFGGTYADAYCEPFVSIDEMLKGCTIENNPHKFACATDAVYRNGLHNGLIFSTAHHPFLKKAIDLIVENVTNEIYPSYDVEITGPVCFAQAIKQVLGIFEMRKTWKKGWQRYGELSFYLFDHVFSLNQDILKGVQTICRKKYSIIQSTIDTHLNPKRYSKLFSKRKIYKSSQ